MDLIRSAILTAAGLLVALNVQAGQNPIGWSQAGEIPAITKLDQSYSVSFTLRNNLPFTMPTPLEISNHSTPLSEVSLVDDCSGRRLTPGQTCDVGLVLIPRTAGNKQLSVFMEYGRNKVQIPKTPIKTQTQSAPASQLQGEVTNGLPSAIRSNSTYTLTFTFSNNGTTPLNNFIFAPDANNTSGYTQTSTTDCGSTLPAGGPACVITGTFSTAITTGVVKIGYTGTSGSLSASPVTSSVINNNTGHGTRTFTFVNNCSQKVWFYMNGGGAGIWGCTTDATCDTLSGVAGAFACDPTAFNAKTGQHGQCFWKSPKPANGNYELAATNGMNTVILTEYVYSPTPPQPEVWSGNIAGRTGCNGSSCATADCGAGSGACPVGRGFSQPAMQAEPTFQTNKDSYDITGINGINVPMSIEPLNATQDPTNPYTCGSPGITTDQVATGGTIGGCPWTFTTPSLAYNWVAEGSSTPCAANSDCNQAGGEACGLKQSSVVANVATTVCGRWLGYWTANEVCGINASYSQAPYTCTASADGGAKFTQMFGCTGATYGTSCYTSANLSACCGCQNWQEAPTNLLLPSNNAIVQQCGGSSGNSGNKSTNATWISSALPTLSWYKAGCPSNYVYPYDDKSSSYTCSNSATNNSVNYKITFCPGGHTGAPSGTILN